MANPEIPNIKVLITIVNKLSLAEKQQLFRYLDDGPSATSDDAMQTLMVKLKDIGALPLSAEENLEAALRRVAEAAAVADQWKMRDD